MFDCFEAQTYVTAFDIAFKDFSEAQPIVFPTDEVCVFINTKISYSSVIVVSADKLCLNDFSDKR